MNKKKYENYKIKLIKTDQLDKLTLGKGNSKSQIHFRHQKKKHIYEILSILNLVQQLFFSHKSRSDSS